MENNTNAQKHGAEGLLKRLQKNLPLAEDDRKRKDAIIAQLGFEKLPDDATGFLVETLADNILLAERFRMARAWAAEQGSLTDYERLAHKSGWRNDKVIVQLMDFVKAQNNSKTIDYEAILANQGDE